MITREDSGPCLLQGGLALDLEASPGPRELSMREQRQPEDCRTSNPIWPLEGLNRLPCFPAVVGALAALRVLRSVPGSKITILPLLLLSLPELPADQHMQQVAPRHL